jgi:hypothetical protein
MKTKLILATLSLCFLFACNGNNTRSFIPGIYVNHTVGTYSIADDTLAIGHSGSNNYRIHRKTGFNLIRNGRKSKREEETEVWNAVYNEQTKILMETRRGKIITFYPKENMLKVGNREYKKLN